MNSNFDAAMLINSLLYIVPLVGLIITISQQSQIRKEKEAQNTSEATELKLSIRHLSEDIEELKNAIEGAESGNHENEIRLTKLEQQARSLEARVKQLEKEIRYA